MSKWIIQPMPDAEFLALHPELPPLVARLLWNRHLRTQEQIDEFLNPDYLQDIHDPFLFNDMAKAVTIIFTAIAEQKRIVVHGDYDADGVSATAILYNCLKKMGARHVDIFIPHREIDGYGLNLKTVEEFLKQKDELIITCDCGISNLPEVTLAKKNGLQVIITDHHSIPPEIPPADAIIHPKIPGEKYPDKGLCGAAVAFKLVQGLLKRHKEEGKQLIGEQSHESFEKWQLDLVAIATIGDMVTLLGESRTLTRYGLTVLNKTKNLGLRYLMHVAGLVDENGAPKRGALNSHNVGFQIVPRLNAAGRMDHANSAFGLLIAKTETEAQELAAQLNKNNTDRQKMTEVVVKEAREQIKTTHQEDNACLFVLGDAWPTGLLGLVAGKLKDEYYKPVLVMNRAEGEINGSGRSIEEFDLIANLQKLDKYFSKYGGHPQACGFSLKNEKELENFKQALEKSAHKTLKQVELVPKILVDAEVDLDEVNWKLFDLLQKFEPFGQNNEEPKYAAYGLTVTGISPVGQDGRHLRLMVKHNSTVIRKTIGFGLGDINRCEVDWKTCLQPGDKVDLVFTVGVNEWNGNRELQLTIEDIKKG